MDGLHCNLLKPTPCTRVPDSSVQCFPSSWTFWGVTNSERILENIPFRPGRQWVPVHWLLIPYFIQNAAFGFESSQEACFAPSFNNPATCKSSTCPFGCLRPPPHQERWFSLLFCKKLRLPIFLNFFAKTLKPDHCVQGYIVMRFLTDSPLFCEYGVEPSSPMFSLTRREVWLAHCSYWADPEWRTVNISNILECWARWLNATLYPKPTVKAWESTLLRPQSFLNWLSLTTVPHSLSSWLLPFTHTPTVPKAHSENANSCQDPTAVSNRIKQICARIPYNALQSGLWIIKLSLTVHPHHSKR